MRKIPTLFKRDFDNNGQIVNELNDDCDWVVKGVGIPTYKWDGTALKHSNGVWYRRRTIKNVSDDAYHDFMSLPSMAGNDKFTAGFKLEQYDKSTRKAFGWEQAFGSDIEPFLVEALKTLKIIPHNGTYELVGPKINDNRHGLESHQIRPHGVTISQHVPVTFDGLAEFLETLHDAEGIVWHSVNSKAAKIKKRDFGIAW